MGVMGVATDEVHQALVYQVSREPLHFWTEFPHNTPGIDLYQSAALDQGSQQGRVFP